MKGWLPTCPVACQPLSKNWRLPENMLPCIRILVRCIPLRSFPVIRQDCCLYASCFTPGRLKAYQEWLLSKSLSWNSISTYMRTLRAVFNRIFPVGSSGYIPGLFNDVYTKVESRTKRALTQKQMRLLLGADISLLPEGHGTHACLFPADVPFPRDAFH